MPQAKNTFRHESLHDADSVRDILEALTKGLGKGKLSFSDDDGEIIMRPEGLLHLKLRASCEDNRNRVDLRISWQTAQKVPKKKPLSVK